MVTVSDSVKDELLDSLTANEDKIQARLEREAIDNLDFEGSSMSPSQRDEIFNEVDDQINELYANADSIINKLEETLDNYASKIPFTDVNSLEELAESLKKAAELGGMIGGFIALSPVLMPYFEYTDGAADGPVIGLIMGAVIGAMAVVIVNAFSPLAASLIGAAYAATLCGLSFPEIQKKYFSEYKAAV